MRYPAYSKRHSKGRTQATVAVLKQVVASCHGGLRTPSETLSLRWEDIDWEMNRMSIPEPKVEHHEGRGSTISGRSQHTQHLSWFYFDALADMGRVTTLFV